MIYKSSIDKNSIQQVIGILLRGGPSKSRDIAHKLSGRTGRKVKTGTVSSVLSRISDSEKCDLGRFIQKEKYGKAWVYRLVDEARALSEYQAYGLTLKTGEDRYPLERILREYPGLRKYVEPNPEPAPSPSAVRVRRTPAGAMPSHQVVRFQPAPNRTRSDRKMEISFRYSSKYAVSLTASLSTIFLLCCALILTVAACSTMIYIFFYPFLVIAAVVSGLCIAGTLIWKLSRHRR
jgi:hypothetical protein